MSHAIVHTPAEIERMLAHGLAPITDNLEALVALGFERAYPGARTGYESTIYERTIDCGSCTVGSSAQRVRAVQRAFLSVTPRSRARPAA